MDAFEAFRNHRAHTKQACALRRPIARRTAAVVAARNHDHGLPFRPIALRGGEHGHRLIARLMTGEAALALRNEFVLDAWIGKGAAHYHLVVRATADIAAEFFDRHIV